MLSLRDNIVSRAIRQYRTRIFRVYVLIALAIFTVLAILAKTIPYFAFDLQITTFIQKINFPGFDLLMKFVTFVGNFPQAIIVFAIPITALVLYKLRWEATSLALDILTATVVGNTIKLLIQRARPAKQLVNVFLPLHDWSFPSGHVFTFTAFFGFLVYLTFTLLPHSRARTTLLIVFIFLIALISLSRIYLGEHWPSDTIGAYLIGTVWIFGSIQFYRWGRKKFFVSSNSTPENTTKASISLH